MASVVVTMSGDEAKLWKAYEKVIQQSMKLEGANKRVKKTSQESSQSQTNSLGRISKRIEGTVRDIQGIASAYIGVHAGLQLVTAEIQTQIRLQKESLDLVTEIGKAQQEAIKNFTGLSTQEKGAALAAATQIQAETGFVGRGNLVDALGAGFSASGDIEATKDAVRAAAELARLTPEAVRTISAGALDVKRGSGIDDAERNLGFLLSAGSISRVEDPAKLAKTLAPAVASAVATVPKQNQEEAAREVAALFGVFTKAATDTQGDATKTSINQFTAKLEEFFASQGDDPGTIFGRIQRLQESSSLNAAFFKNKFGEAAFQSAFKGITDSNNALAAELASNKSAVQFSSDVYRTNVAEIEKVTPEIAIAQERAKAQANIEVASSSPNAAAVSLINEIARETLPRIRSGGISGLVQATAEAANEFVVPDLYSSPQSIGEYRLEQFRARRDFLASDGLQPGDTEKINLINAQIERIKSVVDNLAKAGEVLESGANAVTKAGQTLSKTRPSTEAARVQASLAAQGS